MNAKKKRRLALAGALVAVGAMLAVLIRYGLGQNIMYFHSPADVAAGGVSEGVAFRLGGLVVPMWRELAEMAYLWTVPHALAGSAPEALALPAATPIDLALRAALVALQPAAPTVPVGVATR